MNNKLTSKVNAQNKVNQLVNQFTKLYKEQLQPFIGQKVVLVTGGFKKELKSKFDSLAARAKQENPELDLIYVKDSIYNLWLELRVRMGADNHFVYAEQSAYIGGIEGINLKEVNTAPPNFKTDYSADEIIQIRKELAEIDKKKSDLQSRLANFGLYDH